MGRSGRSTPDVVRASTSSRVKPPSFHPAFCLQRGTSTCHISLWITPDSHQIKDSAIIGSGIAVQGCRSMGKQHFRPDPDVQPLPADQCIPRRCRTQVAVHKHAGCWGRANCSRSMALNLETLMVVWAESLRVAHAADPSARHPGRACHSWPPMAAVTNHVSSLVAARTASLAEADCPRRAIVDASRTPAPSAPIYGTRREAAGLCPTNPVPVSRHGADAPLQTRPD